MILDNLLISMYIAIISLYFRHGKYHVIITYIIGCIVLLDFTSNYVWVSILPSIALCIIFILVFGGKINKSSSSSPIIHTPDTNSNSYDNIRISSLRPIIFIAASYGSTCTSGNIPIGAISTLLLSDLICFLMVSFYEDFFTQFKSIRIIYTTFVVLIIFSNLEYMLGFCFLVYISLTQLLSIVSE